MKVVQTCSACPSQWDAWTADGDYIYMRYRGGYGYAKSNRHGYIAEFTHGDYLDSYMTLEDFLEKSGLSLANSTDISYGR
ncbi:hypothetical protein AB0K16_22075 [Nonomuraea jabiensis]|uniref:hypothetical protein n=1 Tax=Nonomuraea jabiensis TaxID=882448 RepID=UPI003431673B